MLQFPQVIIPLLPDVYERKFHTKKNKLHWFLQIPSNILICSELWNAHWQAMFIKMNNLYFHEHNTLQALNPLLKELPLGKDCIIFFYIQVWYFAIELSELSCSSSSFFLEARENWKQNRCQIFVRILPLAPSVCCCFIIRVINVSNSPCLATKFSMKIVMRVFRSCFLDSRISLESLIQIWC